MADTAELEARVATLEAQVRVLLRELGAATAETAKPTRSIREDRRCPACNRRSFICVNATHVDTGSFKKMAPLGLLCDPRWGGADVRAPLQFIACRGCGFVETYASDVDTIATGDERVTLLEAEPDAAAPSDGPFR